MYQTIKARAQREAARLGLVGAAAIAYVNQAMAAVPTNVSTALTDGAADAATVAGLVLVAIIGIFAIKLMRRGL